MANFSSTYPATKPVFQADFANGGRIDPRATFSRSDTPPTYAAPSAVHYWSNEKHLSSENLLLQSQTLDTTWAAVDVADPTGSQTAPDGTSTAWLLTADSASSQTPYVRQSPTFSGSTQYTMVGHLKAGTASHGYISFRTQNGYSAYALLDFSGGTVSHAGFGDFTGVTSSVTALGSSWFKVTLTATTGTNLSGSNVLVGISDGTTPVGAGYATWNSAGETMYAWGIQLATTNAKVYDSPSTTQIARSYAPTLKSVATAGAARFEYDPTDGQSMGCLIEGQSTNLLSGSATIGGTYWGVVNATAQQNSAVAPDGTLTAATLVENSAAGAKYAYTNNFTPAASTTYTFSAFVKPNGRNFCMIYTGVGGVNQSSMFNLITGATSNLSGSATNRATQCGNGWWRLSVTVTTTNTTTANFQILPATDATTFDYTGNGYSGLICWGAMLEQSSFASSYIGTTSSTATRAADSLSMPIASTGYTGGPVTLLADSTTETDTNNPITIIMYRDGNNQIDLFGKSPNNRSAYIQSGSQYSIITTSSAANGVRAMRVDTNDIATAINGTIDGTDTSQTLPDLTGATVYIGDDSNGGNSIDGHIKRVAIYNEALSDTNLQAITS